ncbi:hypothetical protein [Streptomyces sp. ADI98-10]|uniref:hypothetical protein n=1 Tax=Streptomyces sp. ADI98-10 TaxID=1522763 RepID=UPI000F5569D6|nr:hypothetical protein [Streptomyces sp. ADI98-10]RPK78173.1 hypothetical protein EES46_34305 [Streptomyces sp. ADI98-10]
MRPSRRPALKASEIPPQNLNLREGERQSIVCPDCDSWHPLYRKMIKTHHLDREVRGGRAPRCPGSAQLIDMDISVEQWGERMLAADSTATGRRSARQHYKPLAQPPTPIYRLADRGPQGTPTLHRLLPLLEHARHAVDQHRAACSRCTAGGRCETGRALEVRAAETQASCAIAREQLKHQERQRGGRAAAPKREAGWAAVLPAVQDADTRRAVVPVPPARTEAPAQAEVPSVPTEPYDFETFDRRQAELGKQYAQRKTTAALPA